MQVIIELDGETLRRLEQVAPAKSRQRSAFIRAAIQKALWEVDEELTRKAYLEDPDVEPPAFTPGTWAPEPYGGFDPPAQPKAKRATRARAKRPRRGRQ